MVRKLAFYYRQFYNVIDQNQPIVVHFRWIASKGRGFSADQDDLRVIATSSHLGLSPARIFPIETQQIVDSDQGEVS